MALFASMLTTLPGMALAGVTAEDAYVRLPPPVADTAAGYVTLRNHDGKDAVLVGASSPVAEGTEVHGLSVTDGMMYMQQVMKVKVPAQGRIEFRPGGMHIMLIGLKRALAAGQDVPITLKFADGSSLAFEAEVRDMRGGSYKHGHGYGSMH